MCCHTTCWCEGVGNFLVPVFRFCSLICSDPNETQWISSEMWSCECYCDMHVISKWIVKWYFLHCDWNHVNHTHEHSERSQWTRIFLSSQIFHFSVSVNQVLTSGSCSNECTTIFIIFVSFEDWKTRNCGDGDNGKVDHYHESLPQYQITHTWCMMHSHGDYSLLIIIALFIVTNYFCVSSLEAWRGGQETQRDDIWKIE